MDIDGLLARCVFPPPGTTVDCAVSGGPDSLALLLLAVEAGLTVLQGQAPLCEPGDGLRVDPIFDLVHALGEGLGCVVRQHRYAALDDDRACIEFWRDEVHGGTVLIFAVGQCPCMGVKAWVIRQQ